MSVTIRIRGLDGLRDFEKKLRNADKALAKVTKNLAEETVDLVREGFDSERDPDGQAWKPLKYRNGRILQDKGLLRNGWHRKSSDKNGFIVGPAVDYAGYHQTGNKNLPQRKMVPDGRLPTEWADRYKKIAQAVLKDELGNG